jgi:hypothetical protein
MAPPAPAAKNWAVVLIHGVGDTTPGAMIDALSGPLAAVCGSKFLQQKGSIDLPEKPDGKFPVFMRRGHAGPDRVLLAEVHWADLTRIGVETHLVGVALVRCVYGIRHLALQAALVPGKLGWVLQAALRSAIFLLQGPVYALFFFEALLCAVYLLFIPAAWDDPDRARGPALAAVGLLAVGLAALSVWRWSANRRRRERSVLWPSLLVVSGAALAHVTLRALGVADAWYQSLLPYLNDELAGHRFGELPWVMFLIDGALDRLYAVIAACAIVAGVVVAVAAAAADRAALRSMWSAWVSVVLLLTLWEVAAAPVNLLAQWSYDQAFLHAAPPYPGGTPQYTVWFMDVWLFSLTLTLVVTASMVIVRQTRWAAWSAAHPSAAPPPRRTFGLAGQVGLLAAAAVLLPLAFVLSPLLALATGVVVLARQGRRAAPRPATPVPEPAPRLIVGLPIQVCLLVFACALYPLAIIDGLHLHPLRAFSLAYGWVYLFYLVVAVVVLSGSIGFRNVLHILMDIIVHFEGPGADGLFLRSGYTALRYPTRRQIAKRLRAVVEEVLKTGPTHLLFIAHSQGTVIALEELRKRRWTRRLAGLQSVTLMTFGSPVTNLYQNYLPLRYGNVTAGRWQTLTRNVGTWVNVYRTDDFVGTRIDSPRPDWPTNVPLLPGLRLRGHTRYWEPEVFRAVRQFLP